MFGINKKDLELGLIKLQKHLCSYHQPADINVRNPCDCKYGARNGITPLSEEGCGCPEVSQALQIIKSMSQEEFEEFCSRG